MATWTCLGCETEEVEPETDHELRLSSDRRALAAETPVRA